MCVRLGVLGGAAPAGRKPLTFGGSWGESSAAGIGVRAEIDLGKEGFMGEPRRLEEAAVELGLLSCRLGSGWAAQPGRRLL